MADSTKVSTVWVYRTANGKYFKNHGKGSWAMSLNGVRAKDIMTNLANAQQFPEPLDTEPYFHRSMRGGKWLQIKITTTIEILVSDQEGADDGSK